jgi:hypothetical protein
MCQHEDGIHILRLILVHKDCVEDSIHACPVTEYAHRPCPPSYFFEPSFNVVRSAYAFAGYRVFKDKTGEEILYIGKETFHC